MGTSDHSGTMWVWIKVHIVLDLRTIQFKMMMKSSDYGVSCATCTIPANPGKGTVTTPSSQNSYFLVVPGLIHSLRAVQVHAGACSSGARTGICFLPKDLLPITMHGRL